MSLQTLESSESAIRVHIDVYSAQTGISRFGVRIQGYELYYVECFNELFVLSFICSKSGLCRVITSTTRKGLFDLK